MAIERSLTPRPTPVVPPAQDAVAVLEADHREIEDLFAAFSDADAPAAKQSIALELCRMLRIHAQIEEEIFYPAARAFILEDEIDEAVIEHEAAEHLIAQIEAMDPEDPLLEARVHVLKEEIEHHLREEEEGMFLEVRETEMELTAVGARLLQRKAELAATPNA